ncbi:MAG TPA: hypothetical protein DFS52_05365, partial [Myxococcales bacterium]|nr:hypothetical protein [Myxococcales bacterium]
VSAFGFGGNNAHLIVEEHRPSASPRAPAARPPGREVAIVAIGAAVGRGRDRAEFEAALFSPERERARRADSIALPLAGTRFTPRDLDQALAQQTWLLAASREALSDLRAETGARAGVFVGMGCDP